MSEPIADEDKVQPSELASQRRTVVEANRLMTIPWQELWDYRELFGFLAWRDFLVRYKQTAVGVAWAVLQPVLKMVVLTIVFGEVAGLADEAAKPYAILVLAAVVPWQFFSQSLNFSSLSLINNAPLVSKTYLPRLLLPASPIIVNFIDLAISMIILLVLMPFFGVAYSWSLLAILPLTLLAGLLSLGAGLFVSAMNVKYRDFKYVLPFLLELGMFITPVGFSSERVPEYLKGLYYLNPMTGVVDGYRWAVFGEGQIEWAAFGVSVLGTLALVYFGLRFFRNAEAWFADVI